ncbi:MAG: hypothetical protein DME99_07720 [Verrucomicrobia bacterium]|nr:MAG: hypothetical protein DME99_07720 [Verrucomicrobiota bacterium]
MYPLIQFKTLVSCGRDPARSLPLRRGFLLIPLILGCFALSPQMQAVSPTPDGAYPNFTTAEGQKALQNLVGGVANTGLGAFALFSDVNGSFNTGVGAGALDLNTADSNTATGAAALLLNTTGTQNTANGTAALLSNNDGNNNTAVGAFALTSNVGVTTIAGEGSFNNAVGANVLLSNTDGFSNNALGESALFFNQHGAENTAVGDQALENNDSAGSVPTTADFNTAVGSAALFSNVDGDSNNAVGADALTSNVGDGTGAGSFNNAMGFGALGDNVSGFGNVAVGDLAGAGNTTGSANTYLGVGGAVVDGENDTIRIGDPAFNVACFIGGIFGETTAAGALPVVVDANGQLGTIVSSRRFKDDIKPMDKASEAILSLKPVTFHYKSDKTGAPQFGLIAEDVAAVNPDLVVRDRKGEILSVHYEAVNAMLLNEFLKEHRTVTDLQTMAEKQQATIALQEGQIKVLTASLREQAAQIQKVSAQVEMIKPAPQVVENR